MANSPLSRNNDERYYSEPTLPIVESEEAPAGRLEENSKWLYFCPSDQEHVYLRKSAQALCDAFNAQSAMVPLEDRTRAWHAYVRYVIGKRNRDS